MGGIEHNLFGLQFVFFGEARLEVGVDAGGHPECVGADDHCAIALGILQS